MAQLPLSVDASATLILAALLGLAAVLTAIIRSILFPKISIALFTTGIVFLVLAAGNIRWIVSRPFDVAVMIDLSPSTRTATYHDRAALEHRLAQLLGSTPYSVFTFSEASARTDLAHVPLEIPGSRTVFDPPPADAIVLFSDARFALPRAAPPTFVIVDPALEHVTDAAVTVLKSTDRALSVGVSNAGDRNRTLTIAGAVPPTQSAPPGDTVLRATLAAADNADLTASLDRTDPWPENDQLSIRIPAPDSLQRWWISANHPARPAPAGWRILAPADLSSDSASYLHAGVIALDNVAAGEIDREYLIRIEQYVRDFGGGLLILGGDHSFAAGGYTGTPLERLSPLASNPPTPQTRWVLLVDSSGSMATSIGDNSRWNFGVNAMTNLLPLLPPKDTVDIGDFARDVRWWATNLPIDKIDPRHLVPSNVHPTGPTNLQPVLEQLAKASHAAAPTQVMIVTDAEASIDKPDALIAALKQKRIHASILSIVPPAADSPLARLIDQTGGFDLALADPRQWSGGLAQLLRSIAPRRLNTTTLSVRFTPAGPHLPPLTASPWNRTWLKADGTELAAGQSAAGTTPAGTVPAIAVPAIAGWNLGAGAVVAVAFQPAPALADALSSIVATPPRDPRFRVAWNAGKDLRVTLDAVDGSGFLNNLKPTLVLSESTSHTQTLDVPQTAPGRYERSIPAPQRRTIARLMLDNYLLARLPVADRYAPEFDGIGNDRRAMHALASQTGGAVIEPGNINPITFARPLGLSIPLTTPFALVGAALIASALIRWRLG